MNTVVAYLKDHLKKDFSWKLYLCVALYLAVWIGFNYRVNLESDIIDSYYGNELRFLWYFLLYSAAYYPTAMLWMYFNDALYQLKNRTFWLYSLFGMFILAIDGGFFYHYFFVVKHFSPEITHWLVQTTGHLYSLITVVLPLYLFYKFIDTPNGNFYGIQPHWHTFRPYLLMLLLMMPLIIWASFQPDFLRAYPTYKEQGTANYLGLPKWLPTLLFEVGYGYNFTSVELIFRGFLVIGMSKILGRGTILPMVVTYAFLHFGKPMGETIGAIFGGYILGVIALYSRSVWGGILIHIGIAWLMEFTAILHQ